MARRGNGGLVGKLNIAGNDTAIGVWTKFEQLHIKSNSNSSAGLLIALQRFGQELVIQSIISS